MADYGVNFMYNIGMQLGSVFHIKIILHHLKINSKVLIYLLALVCKGRVKKYPIKNNNLAVELSFPLTS